MQIHLGIVDVQLDYPIFGFGWEGFAAKYFPKDPSPSPSLYICIYKYTHVCVFISIYMYTHTYIYRHINTYIYVCIYTNIRIYVCVHRYKQHLYTHIQIFVCVCIHMYMHTYIHMYMYVCIYAYISVHTHAHISHIYIVCMCVYMYMYTHIHVCVSVCVHTFMFTILTFSLFFIFHYLDFNHSAFIADAYINFIVCLRTCSMLKECILLGLVW